VRRLSIAREARADLRRIQRQSLKTWGVVRTAEYMGRLVQTLDHIRTRTLPGVIKDELARGYRSLRSGRHIIYFRLTEDEAVITRVLHNSMDHALHLSEK
jgi:toxin ParE1/3/4